MPVAVGAGTQNQAYEIMEEQAVRELEERTTRNLELISDFADHLEMVYGIEIPEEAIVSFFEED